MTLSCREALLLVLDQVDYTKGACGPANMVAACLPTEVIDKAREAIAADKAAEASKKSPSHQYRIQP